MIQNLLGTTEVSSGEQLAVGIALMVATGIAIGAVGYALAELARWVWGDREEDDL